MIYMKTPFMALCKVDFFMCLWLKTGMFRQLAFKKKRNAICPDRLLLYIRPSHLFHSERLINGQFRIVYNENIDGFYRSPYIVTKVKYISLRWARKIDCMRQEMCAGLF
jgi:hypothetical protein